MTDLLPPTSAATPPAPSPDFLLPVLGSFIACFACLFLISHVHDAPPWLRFLLAILPFQIVAPGIFLGLLLPARRHHGWQQLLQWRHADISPGTACRALARDLPRLLALAFAINIIIAIFREEQETQHAVKLLLQPASPLQRALTILTAVLLAPVSEELLFRRGLYEALSSRRFPVPFIVTSLVFAAFHLQWHTVPALFAIGLLLQRTYVQYGLRQAILLHAAYNASQIALLLIFHR